MVNQYTKHSSAANLEAVEGANDHSKYMCLLINHYNLKGSNLRSGLCWVPAGMITFFPMKSVLKTYSSKGDIQYLHAGKEKEHSNERERGRNGEREKEREKEFAKLTRFLSVHFWYIRL